MNAPSFARKAAGFARGLLAGMALAALAGCATQGSTPPPPVVLVHGSWMGAWAWDGVAADLRGRGFEVTQVELPAHGADRTPAQAATLDAYVETVIRSLPAGRPALVVGHSFGGMVISGVAERAPKSVARLVYLAAYLPQDGDSAYSLSQQDPGSLVGKYWTQADPAKYSPATIRADGIVEVFCADCPPAMASELVQRHREEPVPPLGTPVRLSAAAYGTVPRSYLSTARDRALTPALQARMLVRAGLRPAAELDSSHSPMLSQAATVAGLIADIAAGRKH